ncbi:MAG: hypothetical protein RDV41_08025 [Planctomycetota bacterium]|nr:hypothetical protein [Planctomycetota bacterium]
MQTIRRILLVAVAAVLLPPHPATCDDSEPSFLPWYKLVEAHRSFYLGEKTPNQSSPLRITDKGFNGYDKGEIFWRYVNNVLDPLMKTLAAKDAAKLTKVLAGFSAWIDAQREQAVKLLELTKPCFAELEKLDKLLADGSAIPNKADLAADLKNPSNEVFQALKRLVEESSKPEKAAAHLQEVRSVLRRLEDIDKWVILELDWLKEDIQSCTEYLEKHPDFARQHRLGLAGLPGIVDFEWFHKDFAEFLRQAEDILCLVSAEKEAIGAACESPSFRLVVPSQRKFVGKVLLKLKDSPRVKDIFARSFETPYNLTYLNCVLERYSREKADAELADVMLNWAKANPAPAAEKDDHARAIDSFLDVLNWRQGTPLGSESAKDRFEPHLLEHLHKMEGLDRQGAFAYAAKVAFDWFSKMQYDKRRYTVADVFKDSKADCSNMTNICAYLLANAGYGDAYGVNKGGNHWVNAFAADDGKVRLRDCLGPQGDQSNEIFPDNFAGSGVVNDATRWKRTVAAGVMSELCAGGELVRREIPYCGRKREVIKLRAGGD